MTAVATTATIFQMLASNKKGLFLNGEFIDPIRYIDDLKKLGTNLDYK
jgi:hypothetical protein